MVFLFFLCLYIFFKLVVVCVYLYVRFFSQKACICTFVFHNSLFIFPETLNGVCELTQVETDEDGVIADDLGGVNFSNMLQSTLAGTDGVDPHTGLPAHVSWLEAVTVSLVMK